MISGISGNELLQRFLKSIIEQPADEAHIDDLIPVFNGILHFYKCLQGHPTPYHDITEFIYNYKDDIRIHDLEILMSAIELKLSEIPPEDRVKCFRKFKRHILLAVTQKTYIQKVANDAFIVAGKAEKIANKAQHIANSAEKVSNKAKQDSQKADQLAERAEKLAEEADAQAKSTIANYISILGIFASIIFTLFGGVNLIGSTVKLLETSSRLPYLVFIVSLLMICLLTLLNMMVKWVNSVSNLKNALEGQVNTATQGVERKWWEVWKCDFYTKAVFFFMIITALSLVGMYFVKKEPFFSFTEEVTSEVKEAKGVISTLDKPASEVENTTEKPNDDETSSTTHNGENDNKDVKVVKTFTFSNHPNSDKDEKEDE